MNPVNKAFSAQSVTYDEHDRNNGVLIWMRSLVRKHVQQYLKPQHKLLELNAGTGLDAAYFASLGCNVLATDLSDGMIAEMSKKIPANPSMRVQQCSYTELHNIQESGFNYVFSNFGGLNCVQDLKEVSKYLTPKLSPGAYITLVIMPPVCPWEIALVFKGKFTKAFRRFKSKGDLAHLEGQYFKTYYMTPSSVLKDFGKSYKKISLQGLASFSPPPHKIEFPVKYPRLYRFLTRMDESLSKTFPFTVWADHFILTIQYQPDNAHSNS